MTKKNRQADPVAGIIAPAAKPTFFAVFLVASIGSFCVAVPLWLIELWL